MGTERPHRNRNKGIRADGDPSRLYKGEKVPATGVATMSDEDFSAAMWATMPTEDDIIGRRRKRMTDLGMHPSGPPSNQRIER
jgi:hypothetical protein